MNCWKVQKLLVQNFRNLDSNIFNFVPGINCIFGQNGNGKTNLLEAIHLLTNKKSFRKNTTYSQMINIEGGNPELILQSVFENNEEQIAYSLRMKEGLEERFFNNVPEKKRHLRPRFLLIPLILIIFILAPLFVGSGWIPIFL